MKAAVLTKPYNIVFDAVGLESTFNQALKMIRRDGRIVVIGLGFKDVTISPIIDIPTKEFDVLGTLRCVNVFPDALRIVASKKPSSLDLVLRSYFSGRFLNLL